MNPSPITSPTQTALAAQIGILTHSVDRMEQLLNVLPSYRADLQEVASSIHSSIDALNALYDTAGNTQLDLDSLNRRLRITQAAAEKHHNGNIAACGREEKLREVLSRLLYSPDLSFENMDDETYKSIDEAKRLLYPDPS